MKTKHRGNLTENVYALTQWMGCDGFPECRRHARVWPFCCLQTLSVLKARAGDLAKEAQHKMRTFQFLTPGGKEPRFNLISYSRLLSDQTRWHGDRKLIQCLIGKQSSELLSMCI